MTDVVIGVDGGATQTRAVVCRLDGMPLATGTSGPCMPVMTEEAQELVGRHVREAVSEAMRAVPPGEAPAGTGRFVVAAVHAGLTGMDDPKARLEWLRGHLGQAATPAGVDRVTLSDDLVTTFEGALGPAQPGILVYAGSGSVAMVRRPDGYTERAGGYGYLIDDEGGGFDIGRRALRAVVRAWDGRGPATLLTDLLAAHRDMATDWASLRRAVYGAPNPKAEVASITPLVHRAAEQGDVEAARILDRAAGALVHLAVTLHHRTAWPSGDDTLLVVRYAGGVFRMARMRSAFLRGLSRHLPQARVLPGLLPPLGGAVLCALRGASVAPASLQEAVPVLQAALGPAIPPDDPGS